jgi:hypothetical protein
MPWKVAPGVLIIELKRSLVVRRLAVGVLLLPEKTILGNREASGLID